MECGDERRKDLGANAAAVEGAGSIDSDAASHVAPYDIAHEAQRVIDAIEPQRGATMTVQCALHEAFNAGRATTWQPIASAPRDGTELLLTDGSTLEHGSWGFIERSDWDGKAVYGWLTDFGRIDEPTFWMPHLPAVPVIATDDPPLSEASGSVPSAAQENAKAEGRNDLF